MFDLAPAAPAAATLPLLLPQGPADKVSGLIHAATLLAQLLAQGRATMVCHGNHPRAPSHAREARASDTEPTIVTISHFGSAQKTLWLSGASANSVDPARLLDTNARH